MNFIKLQPYWLHAKSIVDELTPIIWQTTTPAKLRKLKWDETVNFCYRFEDFFGDPGFLYLRLYRLQDWDTQSAGCSRSHNPFIDIFISDYLCTFTARKFKDWVKSAMYHEVIHGLQSHYLVFRNKPHEERFDVIYDFWNNSHSTKAQTTFLHLTSLVEMDAVLGEFWCDHNRTPRSEDELYELTYGTYSYPEQLMRRVAKYVWQYYTRTSRKKEALIERRVDMFYNNLDEATHVHRRKA